MKTAGLGKSHKLCSATAIERLFDSRGVSHSVLAYPIRAVWAEEDPATVHTPGTERVMFMISIPKKRLRHAVDRVAMRRKVREAYRLCRPAMVPPKSDASQPTVHLAFIYVANNTEPYERVHKAMERILHKIFPQTATGDAAGTAPSTPQAETPR